MITIIGLGFVGLTSALGFAEKGLKVYGYEISKEKRLSLSKNIIPFHEPKLNEMLKKHQANGNFTLVDNLSECINKSDIAMICVGTPSKKNGQVDLFQIKNSIDLIVENLVKNELVICIKSTVPPSTTSVDIASYLENKTNKIKSDIGLANNPEFLREGFAWQDFLNPDRIVIGTNDEKSRQKMNKIYENFNCKIHFTSLNTSEFIKYASNTLLATLISYSNELEMIAYTIKDIDIKESFNILHEDKRWSGNPCQMTTYASPGFGFGGYCLPKDTLGIIFKSSEKGFSADLLKEVLKTNDRIKDFLIDKFCNEVSNQETITILGLSFKPFSDDVRSTPSAYLIEKLLEKNYQKINVYDPISNQNFKKNFNFPVNYFSTLESSLINSDVVIIATAWPEFLKIKNIKKSIKIFDFRFLF